MMMCRRALLGHTGGLLASSLILGLPLRTMAQNAPVRGVGATFPARIYAEWIKQYVEKTGIHLAYAGTGSGDGVKQITSRSVDFAGSDVPMTEALLQQASLVQFPTVVGGIVPIVNLPGLRSGDLKLTGTVLADIYLGNIKLWNDERIRKLNPSLALPSTAIRIVTREGRSGSTSALTDYLKATNAQWASSVGKTELPAWPVDSMRAKGTDDMVQAVHGTPGSLGYAGFDALLNGKTTWTALSNASSNFVQPSIQAFRSAVTESDFGRNANEYASLINQPGTAWPITTATFILVPSNPAAVARAESTLQFLYWALQRGDAMVAASGFSPLPASLQARVAGRFNKVLGTNKQPLNFVGHQAMSLKAQRDSSV